MSADQPNNQPNSPLVRVESVHHQFGDLTVLDDVTVDLQAGTTAALIGPNGSGKTTLLRIVAGLVSPSSGRIERPDAARPFGYLPQHPDFRPVFTVEETLRFYAGLLETDIAVTELLEQVGLLPARDRRVDALSGGMRRLLGLAQALIGRPPVVLLDEPTGDLDPGMTEHIFEIIDRLAGPDRAVLMATHDLAGAERADSVFLLDRGRIVADGPPSALVEQTGTETLGEAFRDLVEGEAPAISIGEEAS